MKAVILAAGSGSRLREGPKALVKLLGLTLLERTILTAHDAGIDEFIIVVGCSASKIKHFIGLKYPTLKIQWVHNEKWNLQNGYSLWEARQYVYENFVLLMADHVLHPSFLKEFLPVIARLGSSRGNLNIDSEFTQSRSEGTLQPLNDREDAQGDTYAVLAVD
ncbi:MAG: NTP transferase domain-containing protein, partial [Deltaproteobacteria bacterium]|nr:NTP transferase domain-containing protein [Deltaproteobacteria bacterium]